MQKLIVCKVAQCFRTGGSINTGRVALCRRTDGSTGPGIFNWKIDLSINSTTELELFIMKDRPARVSDPEAYGLRHIAFRVSSVDEMVAELESKGIPCEPVRADTFTGGKMTFFRDPDGLPIEIHE